MTSPSTTRRAKLADAAAKLPDSARPLLAGPTRSVTVRVPAALADWIDDVAAEANKAHPSGDVTRTNVVLDLLVVGVSAV